MPETSSRESAILAAKEQICRRKVPSAQEDSKAHAPNTLQPKNSPVLHENKLPRTVPAHVQRRANPNTRTLPPPSTTATSNSRAVAKRERGKGKKVDRFGHDSDSDSEDDRRKRRDIDDGDTPISRRKVAGRVPDVGPSGFNSFETSTLTPEEERRLRLRAELQAAEEMWKTWKMQR